MLEQVSIPAATAILGYDLLRDESGFKSVNFDRVLAAGGLAGSAAALDTKIDLNVGVAVVGRMFNSATGAVLRDHMYRLGQLVPANVEISAKVTDAPVTSPINLSLDV